MERKIANKKVAWTGTVQIIVATNLMMTRIDHVRYEVNLDMTMIHNFINFFSYFCNFKILFSVLYHFKHQGHCAVGWKRPNTKQPNILACRNECSNRPDIGYFAYRQGNNCACYLSKDECPDDDKHNDHNAYQIIKESGTNVVI